MTRSHTAALHCLAVVALSPLLGCQSPDYTFAHPCMERSADAGGLGAVFQSPIGVDSYVIDASGLEVAFTVTCVPDGVEPSLALTTGGSTELSVQLVDGTTICTATEPDLYETRAWECATALGILGVETGSECGGWLGETTLGVLLSGPDVEPTMIAEVDTPFPLTVL